MSNRMELGWVKLQALCLQWHDATALCCVELSSGLLYFTAPTLNIGCIIGGACYLSINSLLHVT